MDSRRDGPRDAALLISAAPPSNLSSTLLRQYGRTQRRLFEIIEQIGAGPRHRRVGRVTAGQGRPAALLYEGGLLPRADLFQFDEVRFGPGSALELVDADGSKSRNHRGTGTFLRQWSERNERPDGLRYFKLE